MKYDEFDLDLQNVRVSGDAQPNSVPTVLGCTIECTGVCNLTSRCTVGCTSYCTEVSCTPETYGCGPTTTNVCNPTTGTLCG